MPAGGTVKATLSPACNPDSTAASRLLRMPTSMYRFSKPDAVRTMRTFWSLDLKNLDAGWQVLEPWPGNGRMLAVTAAVDGSFYLSGGCDLHSGPDGKPMRAYQNDSFRYTPGRGWTKIATAPTGIVAAPVPAVVEGKQIIVFGGDDGEMTGSGIAPVKLALTDGEPRAVHAELAPLMRLADEREAQEVG